MKKVLVILFIILAYFFICRCSGGTHRQGDGIAPIAPEEKDVSLFEASYID